MPVVRATLHRTARRAAPLAAMFIIAAILPNIGRAQTTFSAVGSSATVTTSVNAFRTAIGPLNANVTGSFGSGRREINWDGTPEALTSPNNIAPDFFNATSPRGVEFTTPGTGFQVSSTDPATAQFKNLGQSYPDFLEPFSGQRLFTAIGSNVMDVNFFVPGTSLVATTSAFGVVFSDVDIANTSSLEFFDILGNTLGTFFAPALFGSETFSFLGVQFTGGERIGRVRITAGEGSLSQGDLSKDLVAMDDFIYAEPQENLQVVPEPGTFLLLTGGLAGLGVVVRRRKAR
jgi:hypothetical protein